MSGFDLKCLVDTVYRYFSTSTAAILTKGSRAIKKTVKKGDNVTLGVGGSPPVPFFQPKFTKALNPLEMGYAH